MDVQTDRQGKIVNDRDKTILITHIIYLLCTSEFIILLHNAYLPVKSLK